MYAQARGDAASEGKCGHTWQMPTVHVTYVCYVTLLAH